MKRLVGIGAIVVVLSAVSCDRPQPGPVPGQNASFPSQNPSGTTSGMGAPAGTTGSQAAAILRDAVERPTAGADLEAVTAIVAEWLDVDRAKVTAGQTFEGLGCDDIEFVEILLETEKRLKVKVTDEALEDAVKRAKVAGERRLSVGAFAAMVTSLRR